MTKTPFALAGISLIAGIITYVALTQAYPFGGDPETIMFMLIIDFILLMVLGVVIARRVVKLWASTRSGKAGSRLHARFVTIFSLLAIIPSILMACFSSLFFFFALQSWFNDKVFTAVNESISVAESYLSEHQQGIKSDTLLMARDLNSLSLSTWTDGEVFQNHFYNLSLIHSLNESIVFNRSGIISARFGLTFSFRIDDFSEADFERASVGEIIIKPDQSIQLIEEESQDKIRALIKLDPMPDTYLMVGRYVDSKVIQHIEKSTKAAEEYLKLNTIKSDLEITGIALYLIISLLLLMAAIWAGLYFATKFVGPIVALIDAAEKIGEGQFQTKVPEHDPKSEVGKLSRTFNSMAGQLEDQRDTLLETNEQLSLKTIFMETVLSGVSSGIIGLDRDFKIQLANDAALQMLSLKKRMMIGKDLEHILPILKETITTLKRNDLHESEGQIKYLDEKGLTKTFLYKIAAEMQRKKPAGYVFTFHDITDLISAQRKAAWSEVARRIAHEIKNPLTPIQLSAERLVRKYKNQITEDQDTFIMCVETIVRQVEQIGRMIDEFSDFARMPSPIFKEVNIIKLCKQALFLQESAYPDITFQSKIILPKHTKDKDTFSIHCDPFQIDQVLNNILQNAIDAIQMQAESLAGEKHEKYLGRVDFKLTVHESFVTLEVIDNGIGIGDHTSDEITEPYITTKEKGTGLGLAIVKKIIEDHTGRINITGRKKGVSVEITLPFDPRKA